MTEITRDLFSIVSLGSIFVLASLGLYFTFGLLGLVNLVHGELLLLGGFCAYAAQEATGTPLWGFVAAPLAVGFVGAVLERGVLRFFYDRLLDSLLATFGLGLIIRQMVQLRYSTIPRRVLDPLEGSFVLFGANIPRWRLLILVLVVLILVIIHLIFRHTSFGVRSRATVQNAELAATMGVNVALVRTALFTIGAALAGLAGAVLAPLYTLDPFFGLLFLVNTLLVVILGGIGSFRGLIAAGFGLGAVLAVLQFSISTVLAQMLMLILAAAAIRYRPAFAESGFKLRQALTSKAPRERDAT